MPPHPLSSFEIKTYYQDELRFNGVYPCDNLPKMVKDGAHALNLDEYANVDTHWIALHVLDNDTTHFDGFGVEHVRKEVKRFIGVNKFRIQVHDLVTCGYFCIGFIDYTLARKNRLNIPICFRRMIFKKTTI